MPATTTSEACARSLDFGELIMPTYEYTNVGMRDDECGYWTCRVYADCVALNDLWVRPGFRNQGIGAELLDEVIEFADGHDLPIALYCAPAELEAGPYAPKKHRAMDFIQLKAWYGARGFDEHPKFRYPEILYRLEK